MRWNRRAILLAGTMSVAAVTGCSDDFLPPDQPACRSPESLVEFDDIAGATLGYEVDRSATKMRSDPRFLEMLAKWADEWAELSGMGAVTQVWSYGAYVDKCESWHSAGRAFDFAEVVHAGGSVSCRYDTWQPGSPEALRNYWRLAASLHLHFAHTLTYLFDERHHNHIHIDNGISGFDATTLFNEQSGTQVQMVQSALRHVHGVSLEATGRWDGATRTALRSVQTRLGITAPLREPEGWLAFLRATARG